MRGKAWINGRFVDTDKAKVSIFDRSFLYGDSVFETMRSYAGVVFKLDEHLSRLLDSLKVLKIRCAYTKDYLKEAVYNTLKANKLKSAYVRLVVTRGEGRFGIGYKDKFTPLEKAADFSRRLLPHKADGGSRPPSKLTVREHDSSLTGFTPNLIITVKNFERYPAWMFSKGISAKVIGVQNDCSILSRIKTANYLNLILARFNAQDMGFDEAILTNTKGHITEGATSNIFLVKSESVITPSLESGVLPGITRRVVIDIAKRIGLPVKERIVARRELSEADEVFLTNSLAEVLPVTRVDSKRIGDGIPGQITKTLRISYQKHVIREVLFTD